MTQTRIQEKFYPLTSGIINLLRGGNLTATEWRIWSYLVELDPFGDRYEDFDLLSVMSVCECSKSSLYRALAKFQKLKIFDFQSLVCLKNLTGASQLRKPKTEQPNSDPQTEAKTEAKPKPKPKPKTKTNKSQNSESPKTKNLEEVGSAAPPASREATYQNDPWDDHPEVSDPLRGSLRDRTQEVSDHPENSDRIEFSDRETEISDRQVNSDRTETSDLEEIRSAARQKPPVSEMRNESQNWESSLKNENPVPELGNESQNWENESLKPLSDIELASPQNFQRELDPPVQPDGGVAQNNSKGEEVNQSERVKFKNEEVNQNEQIKSKNGEAQNEGIKAHKSIAATEKKEVPRAEVQNKTKVIQKRPTKEDIPKDLVERLEELEIPLDEKVKDAIASHHISQAYGAATHVENTWDNIKNPRGVFLFQLPKQKIEKLGARLPEIGKQMREEYAAIEEEMATPEYQETSQVAWARIKEILGKKDQKK